MCGAREEGGYSQIVILTHKFQTKKPQILIQINLQIHILH